MYDFFLQTQIFKLGRTNTEWRDASPTFNARRNGAPTWASIDAIGSKKSRADFKASTGLASLLEWPLGYITATDVPHGYSPPKDTPASTLAWTLKIPPPLAAALVPRGADAVTTAVGGVLEEEPPLLEWTTIPWRDSPADFTLDVVHQDGIAKRTLLGSVNVNVRELVDELQRGEDPSRGPLGPQSELYRWFPLTLESSTATAAGHVLVRAQLVFE